MLMTMSISTAPSRQASSVSKRLASVVPLPWGKPMTTPTLTGVPATTLTPLMVLPVFTAPALPAGVAAVNTGALDRIFGFVQAIKARPAYTDAIGMLLGIVGAEDAGSNPLPTFTLKVERGTGCECVRVTFRKFGHDGVVIFCRRNGGAWEMLAIDLASPYLDDRPLLVAAQPEVRA